MQQDNSTIHFGAGPATLPISVLKESAQAILNYRETGLSILELAHRGNQLFDELLEESKSLVLELCGLNNEDYEVLWLQGGGRMQFSMIPMNFLDKDATAGYIDSGFWAHDAQVAAKQFGNVLCLASTQSTNYHSLPILSEAIPAHLAYVHLTTNNTIYGTQMKQPIDCLVPLMADMSSDIFSEQRDYSRYDLFYAVAQKNLGIAGVTLVVLHKNMATKIVRLLPPILDYGQQILSKSVLNTPPVFAIYVAMLMLRWIKEKGIAQIEKDNLQKSNLLYEEIERNRLFKAIAKTSDRSKMNVVFRGAEPKTEQDFLSFASEHHIKGIAGHRSVGGFRVSLYNSIGIEQVERLINIMRRFEQENI
ncbi:MAG: 3-phosphoserine/phosphohydroxythreonine transaminase [Phycisphaerales bacterium]|nr:3-phosphoserine/phosphohydroxythreonine transaminase [Phycisphaerales bacterium]